MWDFSDDEWLAFIAAAAETVIGGLFYYIALSSMSLMGRSRWRRILLAICPPAALAPASLFICA